MKTVSGKLLKNIQTFEKCIDDCKMRKKLAADICSNRCLWAAIGSTEGTARVFQPSFHSTELNQLACRQCQHSFHNGQQQPLLNCVLLGHKTMGTSFFNIQFFDWNLSLIAKFIDLSCNYRIIVFTLPCRLPTPNVFVAQMYRTLCGGCYDIFLQNLPPWKFSWKGSRGKKQSCSELQKVSDLILSMHLVFGTLCVSLGDWRKCNASALSHINKFAAYCLKENVSCFALFPFALWPWSLGILFKKAVAPTCKWSPYTHWQLEALCFTINWPNHATFLQQHFVLLLSLCVGHLFDMLLLWAGIPCSIATS